MDSPRLKIAKQHLRQKMRARLERMRPAVRRRKSLRIMQRLIRLPVFQKAQRLMIYMASKSEVQTRGLIRTALRQNKQVYLPRLNANGKVQIFRVRNLTADLERGAYGIREPRPAALRRARPAQLQLAVVPGLAFDSAGRRLGRGGGHFDRFLKSIPPGKVVGLAYREQKVRAVPCGRYDRRAGKVITD